MEFWLAASCKLTLIQSFWSVFLRIHVFMCLQHANAAYDRLERVMNIRKGRGRATTGSPETNIRGVRELASQAFSICQEACTEEGPREEMRQARHQAGIDRARAKVQEFTNVSELRDQVRELEAEVRRKKEAQALRMRMRELEAQLALLEANDTSNSTKGKTAQDDSMY